MYHSEDKSLQQGARQNFVKKVYTIICIQLAVTMFVVYLNFSVKSFARYQKRNTWTFWLAFIGTIITLITLMFGQISKKVPINYVMTGIFTLCESYLVSYICSMYTASSVLLAASATLAATIGLTFYAMNTKEDFSSFSFVGQGVLQSFFWIVFSISLINLLFLKSTWLSTGVALIFAVIYSIFLLVDTQMVLGGKSSRNRQLKLDDYILGAIIIYSDIISFFLKMLQILGKKKD